MDSLRNSRRVAYTIVSWAAILHARWDSAESPTAKHCYTGGFNAFARRPRHRPPAEWPDINAEAGFRAFLECPYEPEPMVDVATSVGLACTFPAEIPVMRIYGELGTTVADGVYSHDVRTIGPDGTTSRPTPDRLEITLGSSGDPEQDIWNAFFRDFVADVRSEGQASAEPGCPTFRDGNCDLLVTDAILSKRSRQKVTVT